MAYLVEVPLDEGGSLLVQASDEDLPGDLELAARPGEIVARAAKSLEQALNQIKPAIHAIVMCMRAISPGEIEVEFGIMLGVEGWRSHSEGSSDVHFTVKISWKPP